MLNQYVSSAQKTCQWSPMGHWIRHMEYRVHCPVLAKGFVFSDFAAHLQCDVEAPCLVRLRHFGR
ncbi:hypothetical protein FRD01_18265 [Microvenator marinus]|uniref:Uncharacterized protein n=1 Tax=Microvenator marinus TaxID=2600177 RepID=A0A5B8XU46_9DELT|nr:hypothetical protein [Microvenator marinus]QED29150.1 hypothetical protein FRD01_18265 [Microvenator marinus]